MGRASIAERLVLALAQGIAEGRWPEGSALPSLRHLAKEINVSAPTAMKVVQLAAERGLVALRPSRPALILAGARNVAARLLGGSSSAVSDHDDDSADGQRVALLYPEIEQSLDYPMYASLRQHINVAASRKGLCFAPVPWPLKDQIAFALSLPARGYVGAVCLGTRTSYLPGLTALRNQGFPTLIINRRFRHLGLPTITADDYKPSRELALRLVRMGHRNLSMVADLLPSTNMETHEAIRGWVDGLDEAGVLEECPMPTYIVPNLGSLRQSSRTFEQLLLRPDRPTALFFFWPVWSDVLLTDPRFARFRVPDDVSLILAMPGERPLTLPNVPPLTALDYDYQRHGDCIANGMADLINGKPCTELLLLPLRLHLTESIGSPPPRSGT